MVEIIFSILYFLFWPLLILGTIIGGIVYLLRRRTRASGRIESEWCDKSFFSKEDFVSQFFLLFSVILSNIALWIINYQTGEIVSGTTVFLISSLIGLAIGYYFRAIWTFVLSTIGLAIWWFSQASVWINESSVYNNTNTYCGSSSYCVGGATPFIKPITLISAFIFIAIIFYLLGRSLERKEIYKRLAKFYSFFGLISITGALFIFSGNSGIGMLESATKGVLFYNSWQLVISLIVFLGSLIVMLNYSLKEKLVFAEEAMAIGFLAIFFLILVFLPEQGIHLSSDAYYYHRNFSGAGIFWAIVFNCLVFLEVLGIVFLGYLRRQNYLINLGALALFLLIIVKYFDWFGNLAGGAFFIGAGILLFAVGWSMEKGRRYMLAKIQNSEIK